MKNSKLFYINSRNRLSGTNSNFQYKLQMPDNAKFTHCVVMQASIPKSYYLVPDEKNTFVIDENGTYTTVTITPGSYTRKSFLTYLNSILNPGAQTIYTYTVLIPEITNGEPETGKFTYTVSDNMSVQPIFIFSEYLYELLGFNNNSSNIFIDDVLISQNVVKFEKEDTVYIHSDMSNNDDNNILQEIYTHDSSDFSNIVFQNITPDFYSKKITTIDSVYTFFLTDENNQQLNLNGNNWQMSILMYEKENINEMIKRYIQIKLLK